MCRLNPQVSKVGYPSQVLIPPFARTTVPPMARATSSASSPAQMLSTHARVESGAGRVGETEPVADASGEVREAVAWTVEWGTAGASPVVQAPSNVTPASRPASRMRVSRRVT